MVKSLETQAYNDLIKHYWNDSAGNFSFSINEKISSPAITSICVMAINNYENPKGIWLKSNKIKIEKYLEDSYPWKDAGKHYQNNMAMAFGFLGLKTIGSRNKKMMDETIEYLKFEQNSDGGWFFKKEIDSNSHPYFTYWVLRCFLTLEPSDLLWLEVIAPAYNNLLESIKTNYMNPTTYCMVRHILHLVYETYEEFLDDSLRQEYRNLREYKVERFQNKNGSWKQEPTVISSAYFRKSLFTIKNMYFLAERKYRTISDTYDNMLSWIQNNHLEPGWASDVEPGKLGVSWATAYILLGLTEYRKAVRQYIG